MSVSDIFQWAIKIVVSFEWVSEVVGTVWLLARFDILLISYKINLSLSFLQSFLLLIRLASFTKLNLTKPRLVTLFLSCFGLFLKDLHDLKHKKEGVKGAAANIIGCFPRSLCQFIMLPHRYNYVVRMCKLKIKL